MDKFEKLQFLQPKIDEINYLIESYFNAYPNETTVKAKALEEFARSRGHNISQETIKQLWLPIPSADEQIEISNYLDKKCSALDRLIFKKQQYLTEIENYKKSLIYEYVTGKKEVI